MPQERNEKGFFERQVDKFQNARQNAYHSEYWNKFNSICATVGVLSKPFRNWAVEQIKYVIEAFNLNWSKSRLLKLLNPQHELEYTKLLFKCFKENIALSVTNKFGSFEENRQKIEKAIKTRMEYEKAVGAKNLYNSQLDAMTPDQRAIYSEVPEDVKMHFINICMQSTQIKLTDLDPNMTPEQANILASAGKLYFEKYPKKDVLSGKIFKDKDGNLLPADKMLDVFCKDYSELMLHEKFSFNKKQKENYALLQKLSYKITGHSNKDLDHSRKGFRDPSLDYLDLDIKYDYINNVRNKELDKNDRILIEFDKYGKFADEMSYDDIEKTASKIAKEHPELGDTEHITDVIRCTALGINEIDDKTVKEVAEKYPRGKEFDAIMIDIKARMHFECIEKGIESPFEGTEYELNGQKIRFEKDSISAFKKQGIRTDEKGQKTFIGRHEYITLEDYHLSPNEFSEKLINFRQFCVTGLTQEDIAKKAQKAQEEAQKSKEAIAKEQKYKENVEKIKHRDISEKIGAKKDVNILQNSLRETLNRDDIFVILTKTGTIQIASPEGDRLKVINFKTNGNELSTENRQFLKKLGIPADKQNEILNNITEDVEAFNNNWNSNRIANSYKRYEFNKEREQVDGFLKEGVDYTINVNMPIEGQFAIQSKKRDEIKKAIEELKKEIPSLENIHIKNNELILETVEDNFTYGNTMCNNAKGLIVFADDKNCTYDTLGINSSTDKINDTRNFEFKKDVWKQASKLQDFMKNLDRQNCLNNDKSER